MKQVFYSSATLLKANMDVILIKLRLHGLTLNKFYLAIDCLRIPMFDC